MIVPSATRAAARHIHSRRLATAAAGHLPNSRSQFVPKLNFINNVTGGDGLIPTYRVLDGVGKPIDGAELPEVQCLLFMLYQDTLIDLWTARQGPCTQDV
jgi:hypothetical protein